MKKVTHLYGNDTRTACGRHQLYGTQSSPVYITCLKCRKTKLFKELSAAWGDYK